MTGTTAPLHGLLDSLAALCPWTVEPSEELRLALDFLGRPVAPDVVVRAGYVAGGLACVCLGTVAFLIPGRFRLAALLGAATLGLLVTHVVHAAPRLWATAKRTRALGAAPDLVARAVLSMRLSPAPERAASFAANTGEGVLAASLHDHVRANRSTPTSGLVPFGDAWADLFPELRRSVALVSAAGATPDDDRDRLLDRALAVVMDGARDEMQAFGAEIRTPATALYAFGVLLPTALVALLPAGGAVGFGVTPASVVLVYDIVLPATLIAAAVWLLAGRPVAFPPPDVSSEHPDVPERSWRAIGAGIGAAVLAALGAWWLTPPWGPPVAAAGLGVGSTLWVRHRSVVGVYDRIERVEDSLADALTLVGRQVANGRAVETAIAHAAEELDGPIGVVLEAGVRRQRQLQVGVEDAFLGRHGALEAVPSPRVRGSFALLAAGAEEGRPAGAALLSLADHVEDLRTIEREARYSLADVCRTLRTTGAVFAPIVAGATVALAEGIGGGPLPGGGSLAWLGGPVGAYVLVLAAVLTALSLSLTRGFDSALVGYRVGQALVCATVTYLGAYLLVGTVL